MVMLVPFVEYLAPCSKQSTDRGRRTIGNGWRAADILNAVKDAQSLSVEDIIHIIDPFANLAI